MACTNCYCLDTSFLINGWNKRYRIDVFPTVWATIEANFGERAICSCEEVYNETQAQRDELSAWTKRHRAFFHNPGAETLAELARVMARFPNFVAQGGSTNGADPLVIAQAIVLDAVVVTDEVQANTKPTKPPKIPNACDVMGVRWVSPIDFLKELGVRL
jgi:Domain of unknown function (DUF4411)